MFNLIINKLYFVDFYLNYYCELWSKICRKFVFYYEIFALERKFVKVLDKCFFCRSDNIEIVFFYEKTKQTPDYGAGGC